MTGKTPYRGDVHSYNVTKKLQEAGVFDRLEGGRTVQVPGVGKVGFGSLGLYVAERGGNAPLNNLQCQMLHDHLIQG